MKIVSLRYLDYVYLFERYVSRLGVGASLSQFWPKIIRWSLFWVLTVFKNTETTVVSVATAMFIMGRTWHDTPICILDLCWL